MQRFLAVLLVCAACGDGSEPSVPQDSAPDVLGDAGTSELCRDGWCWLSPSPQGNELMAISGTSSTNIWAVGRSTTVMQWSGTTWTVHVLPPPPSGFNADLYAVHAVAPDDVWVGGDRVAYHWNGTSWSTLAVPGTIRVIRPGAAGETWAVEDGGLALWNGSTWVGAGTNAPTNVLDVGFVGGSLYAVTTSGGIYKRIGTSWGVLDGGNHPGRAAFLASATAIVVAGDNGTVSFFDGSGWTSHNTSTAASWTSLVARSLTDVWVTDGHLTAHWNGSVWSESTLDSGGPGFNGLWVDPSGAPWITSGASVQAFDGSSWRLEAGGSLHVQRLSGTSDNNLWAATRNGAVTQPAARHWNGTTWSDAVLPAQPVPCFSTDIFAAGTEVWMTLACKPPVGEDTASRRVLHYDGASWSTIVGPLGTEIDPFRIGFDAVWGSSSTDVYVAGPSAVYHFDGVNWAAVTTGPSHGNVIFGSGATDVYVAKGVELWHWDGAWHQKTSPNDIVAGWANSSTDVWLGGTSKGTYFDGTVFIDAPFSGAPVGSASRMFVYEPAGAGDAYAAQYQGGLAGTRTATPSFFRHDAAWRSPSGRVYVVSAGAVLFHDP